MRTTSGFPEIQGNKTYNPGRNARVILTALQLITTQKACASRVIGHQSHRKALEQATLVLFLCLKDSR